MIRFTIPGRVTAKGRPKFTVRHGLAMAYTPSRTRGAEKIAQRYAVAAMGSTAPMEGAMLVTIRIVQTPPVSWSMKKRAAAKWITGRPDCDNCGKLYLDSMNNIVYGDDAQIADLRIVREYSLSEAEGVEITVIPLGSEHVNYLAGPSAT